MTAAMSQNGTLWSPTPWSRAPAGADSAASRNSRAASSVCTAGPPVGAFADVGRRALVAGDADKAGNEPVLVE